MAVLWVSVFLSMVCAAQDSLEDRDQGAYLVRMAGCADCHTVAPDQPMAGGLRLDTPFGFFFTPNLTPAMRTGLGGWSFEDFKRAMREGRSPAGQIYYPAFPYRSYTKITDEDLAKIWAYMRTWTPIENPNRSHRLIFPFGQRWLLSFWQALFFRGPKSDYQENIKTGQGPFTPDPDRSAEWNRGAYLVESLFHCAECHTPRNFLGAPESENWMAGTNVKIAGRLVPNITPNVETGTGLWNKRDWLLFLRSGLRPNGTYPGGDMALVIQNTSALTPEDRAAVASYLMSLPPMRRRISEEP